MPIANCFQTHPLLLVAVSLSLGIFVGDATFDKVIVWWWLIAASASLLLFFIIGKRRPYGQSALLYLATFFVGATLVDMAESKLYFPFNDGDMVHYEAVLADEPRVLGKTLQCDLLLTAIGGKALEKTIGVKAAILRDTATGYWQRLHVGNGIEAWSVMRPLENFRSGGNFDYVRWLHVRGFRAQTLIYYTDWIGKSVPLHAMSRFDIMRIKALRIRQKLVSLLINSSSMQKISQQETVVAAMVLGDKHALNKETKELYSVSGASHVLALSGLHLGIIYAMLTLLFGRLRRVWLCQALVLLAVWAYVMVVGMSTSVMRSAVMLTVYSFCLVARRDKAQINTLAFAAICLLVANPLSLWDIGFQMSFMAVFAIALYYRGLYHLLPLSNRFAKLVWGMAVVSISAQIGTAPLVAYYFGRFSCYFLLTNFIVVPAATLIIYGSVAMFLATPVPWLCSLLSHCVAVIAGWLNKSLEWIASLPAASIDNIHVNTLQLWLIYVVIACITVIAINVNKVKEMKKLDAFK